MSESLDIQAIRARVEKATPGPWEAGVSWSCGIHERHMSLLLSQDRTPDE